MIRLFYKWRNTQWNLSQIYGKKLETKVALIHVPVCNVCPGFKRSVLKSPQDGAVAQIKQCFTPPVV